MKRILIAGCGDIAMRVAPLLRKHYRLFGLVRRAERCAELRAAGITPVPGDLDDRTSLARIAGLADIVLHFAPPPTPNIPSPSGGGLGRGAQKRGYVNGDLRTRNLLAALARSAPPMRLIYISTSGVYGDCGGAYVDETHRPNPQTARAQLRVDAERQIRDWAKRSHVSAGILRVPGIYAADRLPLERLRTSSPSIVHEEDSYTNHIHADDLVRIVIAALRNGKPNRVYHASDDSKMKMGEYFDAVADAHGLPRPPRLPRAAVERNVSPALWSFMNESRRLSNERRKKELKVKLRYPTVADALASIKNT
ncbi:MAG: SDR family oxidoreductase [Gallionella sp.]|nr:SDR family oxidoreductase [Gallionella sp.]